MGKVKEPAATYYSRPMLNALRNHIKDRIEQMDDALWIKESLLKAMCVQPFIVAEYLKLKAKMMLSLEDNSS